MAAMHGHIRPHTAMYSPQIFSGPPPPQVLYHDVTDAAKDLYQQDAGGRIEPCIGLAG